MQAALETRMKVCSFELEILSCESSWGETTIRTSQTSPGSRHPSRDACLLKCPDQSWELAECKLNSLADITRAGHALGESFVSPESANSVAKLFEVLPSSDGVAIHISTALVFHRPSRWWASQVSRTQLHPYPRRHAVLIGRRSRQKR